MAGTGYWWILLAGLVFGVVHSGLATITIKNYAQRVFGSAGKTYYRFFYTVIGIVTTFAYGILLILLPDARIYTIPRPWVFGTLLIEFIAVVCLLASLKQSGMLAFIGLDVVLIRNSKQPAAGLITGGFYKFMRHPIYFFTFVILWLTPLMTWNMLAFVIGITVYTLIGSLFEERRLVLEFGQAYLDYQKKTPWIIPIRFR
jgi:methanethiol S-methyltransferase